MKTHRLAVTLVLTLVGIGLAAPALGQGRAARGDEIALLRAEMRMLLKTMFGKQREQIEALQKQLAQFDELPKQVARLTAEVQRLQELYKQAGPVPQTTAPAGRAGPSLEPVPGDEPTFGPRTGPGQRSVRAGHLEKPKTDFAEIKSLLSAVPVSLITPGSRSTTVERAGLARQVSMRHGGKTIFVEILVSSVGPGRKGTVDVTGVAEASRRGRTVNCTVQASFSAKEKARVRNVKPGQKIGLVGSILQLGPVPAGAARGSGLKIDLSGCRLVGAGSTGARSAAPERRSARRPPREVKAKYDSIKAVIGAIPRESLAGAGDTPEQAKRKKTQLDSWIRSELVGNVLRAEATMLRIRRSRGVVAVQLFHGKPQFQSDYFCYINTSFEAGEAEKLLKAARGSHVEFVGTIRSVDILAGGRFPRIRMELNQGRVISSRPATPPGPDGRTRYPRGPRRR